MSQVYVKAMEKVLGKEGEVIERGYLKSVRRGEGTYMYSLTSKKEQAISCKNKEQAMGYIDLVIDNGLENGLVFIIE